MSLRTAFIYFWLATLLTACGGDSSPNVMAPAPAINRAPVASATTAAPVISESGSITLSAAESSDPEGDTLSYEWVQIGGSVAEIVNSNSESTEVNFGELDLDETATFQVTVSDGRLVDQAQVVVIVLNTSDAPGPDGVLNIRTNGTPIAMLGNIRSRPADNMELLFLETDAEGRTATIHYEVEAAGDGSIAQGVPLRKANGFQGFGSDVRLLGGRGSGVSTFAAIEPDRLLLLFDPDLNREIETVNDDPSKVFQLAAEIPLEDVCLTFSISVNFYNPTTDRGYMLVGYRSGGLSLISWLYDEPDDITETILDETKTYCAVFRARDTSFLSPSLIPTFYGFIDVEDRKIDYFLFREQFERIDESTPPRVLTPSDFYETVDFSTSGLGPNLRYEKSFASGWAHLFTDENASDRHQLLVSQYGDVIDVVDIEGSLPTDGEIVRNEFGSPFYDASISAHIFLVMMQPDMNRVVKIPLVLQDPNCFAFFCTLVPETPIYQQFSSGAATIRSYESRFGFDRRLVFTHPDEKRVSVYPWPSPF